MKIASNERKTNTVVLFFLLNRKRSSCAEARRQGNSPQENNISEELPDYEAYEVKKNQDKRLMIKLKPSTLIHLQI